MTDLLVMLILAVGVVSGLAVLEHLVVSRREKRG